MDVKSRQLSSKQKETLVNFVYARPDMYKGKLTGTYTNAVAMALWKEVTCLLNSIPGGATKDWKQWRKTWTDIKKNVKSRKTKEQRYSQGTGGGPPLSPPDPETCDDKSIDDKILEIITPVAIEGNEDVPEPDIIFDTIISGRSSETTELPAHSSTVIEESMEILQKNAMPDEVGEDIMLHHDYSLSLPSTSKADPVPVSAKKQPMKGMKNRYTKSARLADSISNNKKFLAISQKGILSTELYREKKLEVMKKHCENKANYYKQKIDASEKHHQENFKVLSEISNSLIKMSSK
uniref:Regulatory protein zeste n=1 Tax=Photinus pyralis TaxID=7054 RepID=A0A1Y1LE05_PHOPY